MQSKWWVVIVAVILIVGAGLLANRATAAPAIAITLGTESLVLGTVIDDLSVAADTLIDDRDSLIVRGGAILHGERDVARAATEQVYQWDGNDSGATLNPTGLGGWDFTNGGLVTHFVLTFAPGSAGNATFSLYNETGTLFTQRLSVGVGGDTFRIPFSDVGGAAAAAQVGALELSVPNGMQLATIGTAGDISATRTTILTNDANGNGRADVGDLLTYEVTFTNKGRTPSGAATWAGAVQRQQSLVAGSVRGDAASVTSSGTQIIADLSGLAAGASATVQYAARVEQGAVSVGVVLQEGTVLPEGQVDTLQAPFTSGTGKVGFTGDISTTVGGPEDRFVWYDTGIIWQNSDALPTTTLTGAEASMGVGDNGEFIYSPAVNGTDGVWTHNGLLLTQGMSAPAFPAPAIMTFNSRPAMTPDGASVWVGGLDETGGTVTNQRALYSDADGAQGGTVALLRTGQPYGGVNLTSPTGITFDYQRSDNSAHLINTLFRATGSTATDAALGLNGIVVAREGLSTGGGDNWSNFDIPSVNNSGAFVISGDTSGATATDEFIAYASSATSPTIGIREGSTIGGVLLPTGAAVNGLHLNDLNQAAFIWSFTGGEVLFAACDASTLSNAQAILAIGDQIDIDGGGPDGTINDFNASSVIGPGLWLAEDGAVYVEVDIAPIPTAPLVEAVIRVTTGCAGTGPTPTPLPSATATATETPGPTATATATPPAPSGVCSANPDLERIYFADFENDAGGWTTSGAGEWERGPVVPQVFQFCDSLPLPEPAGSYAGLNVFATNLDGCYLNTGQSSTLSRTFDLSGETGNVTLNWHHWYHIFETFDQGRVLVNGTQLFRTPNSNATTDYVPQTLDLSAYAGNPSVTVEFVLSASTVVNRMGWYVDNVELCSGEFGATPTPTATATSTNTPVATATATPTNTPVATATATATPTFAPTIFPDINVTPSALVEAHANAPQVTTDTLTIQNVGQATLIWQIAEENTTIVPPVTDVTGATLIPAPNAQLLLAANSPVASRFYASGAMSRSLFGGIPLTLDDGTAEDALGLTNGGQFIWFNRFTPNPADYPFTLTEIQFLTIGTSGCSATDLVDFYVYQDADSNPANGATFISSLLGQSVGTLDTLNSYPVNIALAGPGDVLIMAVNRTCSAAGQFPAAIDLTASQTRSWLGYYGGTVANPPVLPAPQLYGTVDSLGFPGNWMIRGVGTTGGACDAPSDIPWLTVSPTSGSTNGNSSSAVTVTYNSASLSQGTYTGNLCITSNDPDETVVVVPVELGVGGPTAVDMSQFTQNSRTFSMADMLAIGLLMVAGVALLLRRQST